MSTYIEIHRLPARQIPMLGVKVERREMQTEADERKHGQNGQENENKLIEASLYHRQLIRLEVGVHHHLGVLARINRQPVHERRHAQRAPAQQNVLVDDRVRLVLHDQLAIEFIQTDIGLLVLAHGLQAADVTMGQRCEIHFK